MNEDKDLNIEVVINNKKEIKTEALLSNKQTIETSVDVTSAGGGTKRHELLVNRELPDQHPISAITELENELNKLATADSDNYNTLNTKIDDTKADIQQDITNLSNTVQSNYTTLNNKIDTVNQELTSDIDDVLDDLFDLDKYVKEQDTQLQTNINTEATTRANSDTLLQNNINTLTNTVSDNYNTLSGLISNEVTNRTQADTNLQTNIDKKVDKEAGKSLILDSEITRLATLHNYDDTALNQAVNNLSTNKADKSNTYTKDEVDAKVSSVYRVCGSVESFSKLPKNAVKGDVYNVLDSGANYVWTGSEWDKLSETVDLTPYLTKQEATNTYQPIISDLATIRTGASKGATALQSYTETDPIYTADKPNIALKSELFSKNYNDLTNKPTIPSKTSDLTNDSDFITSSYHDSTKQDTITDLSTIRSNASNGAIAYTTIQGYGDIVTHNAIEFALKSEIPDVSKFALDSGVVHKANAENIPGIKTFTGGSGGNNVAIKAPNGMSIGSTTQTAYAQYATIRLVNDKVNTGSYYIDGNGSVLFRHKTGTKTAEGSANDVMFTMNPEAGIKAGWSGTAGVGITDSDLHDVLIDTVQYSTLQTTAKDVLGAINEVKASIPSLVGYATESYVQGYHDSTKQNTLVSGTNIKTINNESIVGSGNITIKSAPDLDNVTISKNSNDELQAIALIDNNKTYLPTDFARSDELNNPFTLLESKYSEIEITNSSWLKSKGQWNSKALYPSTYEEVISMPNAIDVTNFDDDIYYGWSLGGIYLWTKSLTPQKGDTLYYKTNGATGDLRVGDDPVESYNSTNNTITYIQNAYGGQTVTLPRNTSIDFIVGKVLTDYDFAYNRTNETFRLPLKNGSEDLPSDRYDNLTLGATGSTYIAPANGWYSIQMGATATGQYISLINKTTGIGTSNDSGGSAHHITETIYACKNDEIEIAYSTKGTIYYFKFIYAQGNGDLYYYVGDTVKNSTLIDVAQVTSDLARKVDINSKVIDGQWVGKEATLSTAVAINTYNIDLSEYLPKDNYQYEVIIYASYYSTNTNSQLYISSDIIKMTNYSIYSWLQATGNSRNPQNFIILPVGIQRNITVKIQTAAFGNGYIQALGYRRIGTNE